MDKASLFTQMVPSIKVNLNKEKEVDLDCTCMLMAMFTMENGPRINETEKAHTCTRMEARKLELGSTVLFLDWAKLFMQTIKSRVIGCLTRR